MRERECSSFCPEVRLQGLSLNFYDVTKWISEGPTGRLVAMQTCKRHVRQSASKFSPNKQSQGFTGIACPSCPVSRIRAVAGHNKNNGWLVEASARQCTINCAKAGKRPGFNLNFMDACQSAMPKVAYHTCDTEAFYRNIYTGLFPGGNEADIQRRVPHCPPSTVGGVKQINIAVDIELLVQLGFRMYAPGDG